MTTNDTVETIADNGSTAAAAPSRRKRGISKPAALRVPFLPLREARERMGLSRRELDELLDRSPGTVRQIEEGRNSPPHRALCTRIEEVLELPAGSLWPVAVRARLARYDPEAAEELDQLRAQLAGELEQLRTRVAELEQRLEAGQT